MYYYLHLRIARLPVATTLLIPVRGSDAETLDASSATLFHLTVSALSLWAVVVVLALQESPPKPLLLPMVEGDVLGEVHDPLNGIHLLLHHLTHLIRASKFNKQEDKECLQVSLNAKNPALTIHLASNINKSPECKKDETWIIIKPTCSAICPTISSPSITVTETRPLLSNAWTAKTW